MKTSAIFALALASIASAQIAQTNGNYLGSLPSQRLYIDHQQAEAVIAAAAAEAQKIGSPSNIAVYDPSALLVGFLRMDNAFPGSSML